MAPLASVPESGKVLAMAHRTARGMRDRLDGGQPVKQRQPNEARRTGLGDQCANEIVDRHFGVEREKFIFDAVRKVERGRLVDGRR